MSYHHFTTEEREYIYAGLARKEKIRHIAADLDRATSSVSREIHRNSDRRGYSPFGAMLQATARSRIPRRARAVDLHPWLWKYIVEHLRLHWSPEQIAARVRHDYPRDVTRHLSHETIYAALYVLPKGTLRKELLSCLRQRHRKRGRRSKAHERRGKMLGAVPICERPSEVEKRLIPGHWEGDLIVGKAHGSAIGTLVERTTRFTILCRLKGTTAVDAQEGFTKKLRRIPAAVRSTLTLDRGSEMARHRELADAVHIDVYFADPRSPWQRGTNENTNGLLRQYFPKSTDLSQISQRELNRVARELNGRPRKVLRWLTPQESFTSHLTVALRS